MPDTETYDLKEKFITHSSQEERTPHAMEGQLGKHQGWLEGRRGKGRHGRAGLVVFKGREG